MLNSFIQIDEYPEIFLASTNSFKSKHGAIIDSVKNYLHKSFNIPKDYVHDVHKLNGKGEVSEAK